RSAARSRRNLEGPGRLIHRLMAALRRLTSTMPALRGGLKLMLPWPQVDHPPLPSHVGCQTPRKYRTSMRTRYRSSDAHSLRCSRGDAVGTSRLLLSDALLAS